MSNHSETPFESIENARDYIRLLQQTVAEARNEIASDLADASGGHSDRRVEALRLVQYKLEKLEQHLHSSGRALNDLRSLRRLLFEERGEPTATRAENDPEAA
ncbi:MAG TPA: hypothetical protein VNW47_04180 [Terriglobales bacterium]|nr:hypothetical protein [Terriglobales bacterium]